MEPFKDSIERNFKEIDKILQELPKTDIFYWFLFSIRTDYAVVDELNLHKGNVTFLSNIKTLYRLLSIVLTYPFIEVKVKSKAGINILGNGRHDSALASEIDISQFLYEKKIGIFKLLKLKNLSLTLRNIVRLLLLKGINKKKIFRCIPALLNFSKFYFEINLKGVTLLIAEDDLSPVHVAILLSAKQQKITRVKIEYFHIDSLLHNNVFTDYYFYPSSYQRNLRIRCKYNSKVKYIEGGYLNTTYLKYLNIEATPITKQILYFTEHSNLYDHNDHYYINEILKVLPRDYILAIKVHPHDDIENYNIYQNDKQIKIYAFGDIENSKLILSSSICLSMFSSVSLEAKLVCNNSYFINYTFQSSCFADDYEEINDFFDTISSPLMLKQVIEGHYKPKSQDLFKLNVNMTFPNTFKIFKDFVSDLATQKN